MFFIYTEWKRGGGVERCTLEKQNISLTIQYNLLKESRGGLPFTNTHRNAMQMEMDACSHDTTKVDSRSQRWRQRRMSSGSGQTGQHCLTDAVSTNLTAPSYRHGFIRWPHKGWVHETFYHHSLHPPLWNQKLPQILKYPHTSPFTRP